MSLSDRIFGKPLASSEEEDQKVGALAGVPMLGLDALSSAAYGPEAALTLLLPLGVLGLAYIGPITLVILLLLAILYFSYRQTIVAYPNGGGSYTVAKENLGTRAGLLAAASLLLDYVLNVAVGIAAGVGALVSAVPALHGHLVGLCLLILALVTVVNLRGVRESGTVFILPTYLFVGCLAVTLTVGLVKTVLSHGHPLAVDPPPAIPVATAGATLWLLLRSFSSGCTAMTGVEAISNGISAFARPAVQNAQRTLTLVVVILGLLLAGIASLCRVYQIAAVDPSSAHYQSVLSMLVAAVMGRGFFYYLTLAGVLAVLCLSANTSYAGFPRLCRLIALDNFLPYAFAHRGRRLVYSLGITILTLLAALLLVVFGGVTDRLIPLFAVGAFGAFTLSQAGMVRHWQKHPQVVGAKTSQAINAVGAIATGLALMIVIVAKFRDGAWITLILIPGLFLLFESVKRHYVSVAAQTRCPRPIDLTHLAPPVVVVPIRQWSTVIEKALQFALPLSPDVIAVHIGASEEEAAHLQMRWAEYVEGPIKTSPFTPPRLAIVSSPFRHLLHPLADFIDGLKAEYPTRVVAIIVPELVGSRWYEYLLHNQRSTFLKAFLLMRGDQRVVVINVPWYLTRTGTLG